MAFELPTCTVREYRPGDEHAILAARGGALSHSRTLEEWRWLYLDNPSGSRIWVAVSDDDGRLVSTHAGVRQRMYLDGEVGSFGHAVDHTDGASDARADAFLLTATPYARSAAVPGPRGDAVLWDLPDESVWSLERRRLKYEVVRLQNKLELELDAFRDERAAAGIDVDELGSDEGFPEDVELLSERSADEHGAIAVRDKRQLDWRFRSHPTRGYAVATARAAGELVGFAVHGTGVYDGKRSALVCDWLVAGQHAPEARRALRRWLVERSKASNATNLTAIFPDTVPEWVDFQRAGFRVRPTDYFPVGRTHVPKYRPTWLHAHWYYTLADAELN